MSLSQVIIPLFTHLLPVLFFVYMGVDVLLRNPGKVEHRLVSAIILCCMLLFMEEYVRNLLPIEYSPTLAAAWFSTVGIMIPGLGFHLFIKLARLKEKMPRIVYPYFFYLPAIIILINLLVDDSIISANEFYQEGLWKVPVYNQSYYIAMISSNVINFLYMIPLAKGRAKAGTRELKAIYNQLILGVTLSTLCNMVFGLIDYGSSLPPYPYLYGCVVWCFILRHTMKTYDFLNFMDKRYEKLFNLNPAAIMLVDLQGNIKEANPSAKQFFDSIGLEQANFYATLHDDFKNRIQAREAIANCEMTIWNEKKGGTF
ncbi:PAS domain-containing protein [Cohnella faecalis]|uniref:PAS domain-containing protein n=1 Tax=Cohnella faecalis TaxID=2315694 RepID=A0A398CQD3_9BACL|nr:PAS domain-containing protein [Cohnella faecalis]RIE04733.1 PAS domain-containing protein [Cohnella faecalis]